MVDCTQARDTSKRERGMRAVRALGTGTVIFVPLFESSWSPENMLTLCASLRSLPLFTHNALIKLLVYPSPIIHSHTGFPFSAAEKYLQEETSSLIHPPKVPHPSPKISQWAVHPPNQSRNQLPTLLPRTHRPLPPHSPNQKQKLSLKV